MISFDSYELEDYIEDDVAIDISDIIDDYDDYLPDRITANVIQTYFLARAIDSNSYLSSLDNGGGYINVVLTKEIKKIDTQTLLKYIEEYNNECDDESQKIKDASLPIMFREYCKLSNMSGHNDLNFEKHNFSTKDSKTIFAYGIDFFGIWLWAIADNYETLKEKICNFLETAGVRLIEE